MWRVGPSPQETVLLNAPAGALRALARLRPTPSERSTRANRFHRRSVGAARGLGARVAALAHVAHLAPRPSHRPLPVALRRSLVVRLASERMIALVAAFVVLGASIVSLQPAAAKPIGDATGAGTGPRIAIGGGPTGDSITGSDSQAAYQELDPAEAGIVGMSGRGQDPSAANAPAASYPDDGTIWKPVAVDTTV